MKWIALETAGDVPMARSSHSITAVGDALYLWGGENTPRVPIGTDMYCYGLKERCWRKVEASGTPPSPRIAHAAAALGPRIYLFGGRSGMDIGEGSLNDLHCFDTEAGSWTPVRLAEGSPLPSKRSYHVMTAARGKLYLFGGCGEGATGRLNDLWEFEPAAATWRQLPSSDAINGRGGAGFAATPDALFVVAGFTGQESNDVHRFDLGTETWDCPRCCSPGAQPQAAAAAGASAAAGGCSHAEPPLELPARSVCAVAAHAGCNNACSHGNHVVVFGGQAGWLAALGHAGAGIYSNDTFCLDTSCQHWHRLAAAGEPPAPRGWMAATACGAGVVVHGGNAVDNSRLADMYLLEMH